MKTVNRICQILAIIFALVSLALFFTPFATITATNVGVAETSVAAELAFRGKLTLGGEVYTLATSAKILFCFCLTVLSLALSAFSFKSKTARYFAPAVGLGTGIYMLVMTLGNAEHFVDTRVAEKVFTAGASVVYTETAWLVAVALFVYAIVAAAHLFIDDYIEVQNSKGSKRTILKRVVTFFKDYKSEGKKIVWPGVRDVVKNTVIVIVMCLIVGAFIWLLDWGLGSLIKLIFQ